MGDRTIEKHPWDTSISEYENRCEEIDALRDGLEHHRLAHDDAKAAWEKECSERDIAEEKLEAAERERDEARAAFRVLDSWSLVFSYTPAYIREAIDAAREERDDG